MKFIFADSMDFVDPGYDFLRDRNAERRTSYWDDAYPHEIMGYAPYDGVLVSRGIVGGPAVCGKYSEAQAMRFRRVGARPFLRLVKPHLAHIGSPSCRERFCHSFYFSVFPFSFNKKLLFS